MTNRLAWTRREFRRLLLETLRGVTGSDEEFRLEARLLLGGEQPKASSDSEGGTSGHAG